ncbi:MAG: N-acetylmannosamine-6-phosphate 2-epimerase [Candidatus Bipolaricaulaceae bacterium]
MKDVLDRLRGGLIVSCQAAGDSPFHGPQFMAAMAQAAAAGGAVAIRADGPADVQAIKGACPLPVIGIYKRRDLSPDVYITPDLASAEAVIRAGADIVALDGTGRARPGGMSLGELIATIRRHHPALVMADVATAEEGRAAAALGADLVATTLSGYTASTRHRNQGPDLSLVSELSAALSVPVVAEGRISTPELACQALQAGAHAVVVGTAITNPTAVTRLFVAALQECQGG